MELFPHQAAFVDAFFGPTSKRVVLLRGDAGVGKTAALAALAARELRERPTTRVLLLVPAALRFQFADMLGSAGTRALLVDRFQFREMLDSTTGSEFWPRGAVAVLSVDFAKQPDISSSLAGARWGLVIADEAHSLKGARAELLRRVAASADRIVLATVSGMEAPEVLPVEETTVVTWQRDDLVGRDGKPLSTALRPVLHEVPFVPSQAELHLRNTVNRLRRVLKTDTPDGSLLAATLRRRLGSSPAALETTLRRVAAMLAGTGGIPAVAGDAEEEDSVEDRPAGRIDHALAEEAVAVAGQALQELEAMEADSKLAAFAELLDRLSQVAMPPRRVCALTDYLATLYYLAAEIEGRGMVCQLLHGGMSTEDRGRSLRRFSDSRATLVATRAGIADGVDLRDVTDLVLYDIPGTHLALQQVLGRFDRIGRRSQLNIHVLSSPDSADGLTSEPLRLLREILGSGGGRRRGEGRVSKYAPLNRYLHTMELDSWRTSFEAIEAIIGGALPRSARKYPAWWANDERPGRQSWAWLEAGYRTRDVDVIGGEVTFVRGA